MTHNYFITKNMVLKTSINLKDLKNVSKLLKIVKITNVNSKWTNLTRLLKTRQVGPVDNRPSTD